LPIRRDALPTSLAAQLIGGRMFRYARLPSIFIAGLLTAAGSPAPAADSLTDDARFTLTAVSGELENPWGLAFLPDGRMLVTERPGRLRIVTSDGRLSEPLADVPEVLHRGQGGLLDVALDPAFATNSTIYLS
jgi:glucose/arabinose dehydrogenase